MAEKEFPLEQDLQGYALEMLRKNGPTLAIKSEPVLVRRAYPGEVIRTWDQDGAETVNTADEDSYVLTKASRETGKAVVDQNGHENSWIAKGPDFRKAYFMSDDFEGEGLVDPIASLRTLVKVDKDLSFMASWGTVENLSAGGYLNITNPADIYGVSESSFNGTHVDAPMAAKFIDPEDDNPFWAQGSGKLAYQLDIAAEADEDSYDGACRQADALGMASLTEDQQIMVDVMGQKGLEQAWQFLDDIGHDSGKPPYEIDTGRYLSITPKGSDTPVNVYESVPVNVNGEVVRSFWDVTKGAEGGMYLQDDQFETNGVYEGKPFQLARDAICKELGEIQASMTKNLETSGPVVSPYLDGAQSDGRDLAPKPDTAPSPEAESAARGGRMSSEQDGYALDGQSVDTVQLSGQSSAVQKMMAHVDAQNGAEREDETYQRLFGKDPNGGSDNKPDGPSGPDIV